MTSHELHQNASELLTADEPVVQGEWRHGHQPGGVHRVHDWDSARVCSVPAWHVGAAHNGGQTVQPALQVSNRREISLRNVQCCVLAMQANHAGQILT